MTIPTTNPIAREVDDFWKNNQSLSQQWQLEADLDMKMATGQQDYWNSFYGFSNYRNQKMLMFNKILRIINMIGGYQRDNRLASVMSPSDNDPDMGETADQRTTTLDWVFRKGNFYETISDGFDGSNICGLNLWNLWMDFREDPESGTINMDRLPFSSFILDSYWTKPDLSDCDRILTRRYVNKKQLGTLVPGINQREMQSLGKGYTAKDGKFPYLPQNWYQYEMEMYSYDEYWTREYKTKRKILDKTTGEMALWKGNREQFQFMRQYNPNLELIKAQVPTVKRHVLINNNLIDEEIEPYGLTRMPFVPSICYFFPEIQNYSYRFFGITRNIRDSQVELNRRRNRLLDILDAQVQSGLMVKEDALVNPEDAFFQGPGKVLYFKQTANLATDVAPIPSPPVAPGWLELIESVEKEIMDIVGPEELFAQNMGAKDMSGVLMKLKMGAGLTGLRNIFDRLNQAQKFISEITDEMITNNFSEGKVTSILGKKPTEHFFDREFIKFNVQVEEAELTATQRQLKFLQAVQLKQIIPNSISDQYLLENSTLQGKKELVEYAKQAAQQMQQQQQAMAQAELQQSQMLGRSLEAKAQSDFASAEEKQAKSITDIAMAHHHAAQSVQDRASAALDNAKALHELDQIPESRLMNLITFIADLEERQRNLALQEEAQAMQQESMQNASIKQERDASSPSQPQ